MASTLRFTVDPIDLQEEIKRRDDLAESTRRECFVAARGVQAWFRGIVTRNHLRLLHERAITIQRHWRGYRVRMFADRYLVERVRQMWQDHYDRMATRIQAIWRGYWVRKTVLDIPKMRRWLKDVYAKNQETVENMKKFRRDEIEYVELVVERESMHWILYILFKLHHLLRTKQRPGVITRIDRTRFTFIEEMLKCLEYRNYGRKRVACKDCRIDREPSLILRGTRYERCEREIREIEKNLQAGVVPIFRSEPYEEQEKLLRELNRVYQNAAMHDKYEAQLTPKVKRGEGSKANLESPCIGGNELYEEIRKMDCHLPQLRMRCPVHGHSSSRTDLTQI